MLASLRNRRLVLSIICKVTELSEFAPRHPAVPHWRARNSHAARYVGGSAHVDVCSLRPIRPLMISVPSREGIYHLGEQILRCRHFLTYHLDRPRFGVHGQYAVLFFVTTSVDQ